MIISSEIVNQLIKTIFFLAFGSVPRLFYLSVVVTFSACYFLILLSRAKTIVHRLFSRDWLLHLIAYFHFFLTSGLSKILLPLQVFALCDWRHAIIHQKNPLENCCLLGSAPECLSLFLWQSLVEREESLPLGLQMVYLLAAGHLHHWFQSWFDNFYEETLYYFFYDLITLNWFWRWSTLCWFPAVKFIFCFLERGINLGWGKHHLRSCIDVS